MAEHPDLAAYLLGELAPEQAAAVEDHLRGCDACRREADELGELPALLALAAPPFDVPADLQQRTLARMAPRARRRPRIWWGLVPAAAAAAATVVLLTGRDRALERYALRGGGAAVSATVQTTGVGREVTVRIERLRDPRPDGLYELWFVARDDRRGRPHRVSAGTFLPDDAGKGTVRLIAAADPAVYLAIAVTLEPADGDPRRQGPTVLRAAPP